MLKLVEIRKLTW